MRWLPLTVFIAFWLAACARPTRYYTGREDAIRDGEEALDDELTNSQKPANLPSSEQDRIAREREHFREQQAPSEVSESGPPPLDPSPTKKKRGQTPAPNKGAPAPTPSAEATVVGEGQPIEGLAWPVEGMDIVRMFGQLDGGGFHRGVDVKCEEGATVWAAADGEVVFAGRAPGRGRALEIRHSETLTTVYAHLLRLDVRLGQKIQLGVPLGVTGGTIKDGPHLHFEVWQKAKAVDPMLVYRLSTKEKSDWFAPLRQQQ